MAMTVELTYYVSFGPGDGSDIYDYDLTLTDEEEQAYLEAMRLHVPFEDYPVLEKALKRAYDEIEDSEVDNLIDMDDEFVIDCMGRNEIDPDELNELVSARDPHALDYFCLTDASDEELEEWDAYDLDELPMVCDWDDDFCPESPFSCGWSLVVEFADDPENCDECEE